MQHLMSHCVGEKTAVGLQCMRATNEDDWMMCEWRRSNLCLNFSTFPFACTRPTWWFCG